ncbi:DUF1259 domain-containing protein [Amycolatopsis decaplanina]|uniref:Putative lipoprotein LpqO n=1 Tax=Amycolatopsis decaplanina DSM 44594 TaxID=1284240 RepID=M2Z0Y7_9PSEU|nr:DUF1259 domain-containing protein [Amycolatopsis decaplanina]EME60922.1 putative lipoprotein LpqO [Amycolatopsis decaplanina DSM 44594]
MKTTEADWKGVADALGRSGKLSGETVYRVGFPRRDLPVVSKGVRIKAGFALGSYAAFVRYRDGKTMVMGDLVITEDELPRVTDVLQRNGISQTAVHKHLLAHEPQVWWCHIHAEGTDPVAIAQGIKAALDVTTTPPAVDPTPPPPLDLDTAGIDAALGAKGTNDGGIYKFSFACGETVTSHRRVLLPAMGVNTALNFQPVGGGRAAINGDFVMTEHEVQNVIKALRAGGIEIVELHHHALDDRPRLFYMHFWAVDDGVKLAKALRGAVDAHNVHPAS